MVLWIVIAVVVLALVILGAAVLAVLGRLSALDRAMRRLMLRREQAEKLQAGAAVLERTLAGLQERAAIAEEQVAIIKAGRGEPHGKHSSQKPALPW
jgi:type II secretory pathway component PulJ